MRFESVAIEAVGYCLPRERVSSDEIERGWNRFTAVAAASGRLELMTGIRERRFWPPDTLPSDRAFAAATGARRGGFSREEIGCLIHGSVCRDHLEPATACRVHHELSLPAIA